MIIGHWSIRDEVNVATLSGASVEVPRFGTDLARSKPCFGDRSLPHWLRVPVDISHPRSGRFLYGPLRSLLGPSICRSLTTEMGHCA
ncbi:hypothetical protein H5410_026161 [Solanum commersonii]|uniref:Uncharacterized protein n=1 Tax=Solanum commersonii TaxID=4109 RepID=A0A9J5YXW1_SOLCO|nr:hypothetical protein H5410_026161 [Solanum commersonii]